MMDVIAMADLLEGEYKIAFQKADMYATVNGVELYEDRVLNLYDMLTEAQERKEPVEKIIGNDIEVFCKEYFAPTENEYRWVERLKGILRSLMVIAALIVVDDLWLAEEKAGFFDAKSDIFPLVIGLGVGMLLEVVSKFVLEPIIFKKKKISPAAMSFFMLFLFFGGIIGGVILFEDVNVFVPSWILLVGIGVFALVYVVISLVLRAKGVTITEKKDPEEKALRKSFEKDVEKKRDRQMFAPMMAKRFARIERRKAKKNIAYTFADFATLIRKEAKFGAVIDKVMAVFFVGIVAVSTVQTYMEDGIVGALIMAVILGIVEYGIYRLFMGASASSSETQVQIVEECERLGMTVKEYAEALKNDTLEDDEDGVEEDVAEME